MSEQQTRDVEILEIVLRNKQHAKVNADYEFGAIRRLLNHVKELEQKRDAALELAALYARLGNTDKETTQADRHARAICRQRIHDEVADARSAIFTPKDGE